MSRRHSRPLLAVPIVAGGLLAAACSPIDARSTCDEAEAHVERCLAAACAGEPDLALCRAWAAAPVVPMVDAAACEGERLSAAGRVLAADCDSIVAEAAAAAGGKTDAPCPWYFPWCGAVAPEGADFRAHVLHADSGSLTLQIDLDSLAREPLLIDGQPFETLSFDGAGSTGEIGRPGLPVIGLLVGVPWDTQTVRVEQAVAVRSEILEGVWPTPFRRLQRDDLPPEAYVVEPGAYADYAEYPATAAAVGAPSVWRDYRVVRLEVRPVRAVTALRQVVVDRSLVVTLRFDRGGLDDDPPPATPGTGGPMDDAYAGGLVNYDTAAPRAGRDEPAFEYLVVVDDALVDALSPWLEAKAAAGAGVQVVRLSEIGAATAEAIRGKLGEIYAAARPRYVVLVGAPDRIPLFHYASGWETYPSDLYYSLLEGDDLLADVAIGRLLARTPEELTVVVGKTLTYAAGDAQAPWRRRLVAVAHKEAYPDKYTGCVKSIVGRDYGRPVEWLSLIGGEGASNEQLTAAINEGAGVVSYRGHGDVREWDAWGEGGPYVASAADLHNAERTPVVLSVACLTAAIEQPGSLAEQFVSRAGGGAVAFLGATEPSWTQPNHDFNRYLFRALLERNVHRIGVLLNEANAALLRQYGDEAAATDNVKMYLWLGDPSLEIGVAYHCEPLAIADAGPDVVLEPGGTTMLGAPAVEGTSYAWQPADGLSCADCAQPTVTAGPAAGAPPVVYTVTARTACSVTGDEVSVQVAAPAPAPEGGDAGPRPDA